MIENLSDRIFEPAEVSFKQDINYVLNESVYACTFKPTKESSLLYVDSQKYFSDKHEADKNAKKSCGLILLLIGVFVLCSICKIFEGKISDGFTAFLFVVLFGVVGVIYKLIYPSEQDRFTLKIDDHNCSKYQLRRMSDNRFCIICGSNFNEDNETTGEAYIAEVEPLYSDLIILENVEYIEELEQGVIISGITNVRKYEPDKPYNKYTEMEGRIIMDVFIQRGVYPEEMLENIGDET